MAQVDEREPRADCRSAGVAAWVVARHTEPFLRSMIVEVLEDRFHARVELDSFHISVAHVLTAEGRGLRVWPPAQVAGVTAAPARDASDPLIRLAEFHFRMPLRYERGKPFHIAMIRAEGAGYSFAAQVALWAGRGAECAARDRTRRRRTT